MVALIESVALVGMIARRPRRVYLQTLESNCNWISRSGEKCASIIIFNCELIGFEHWSQDSSEGRAPSGERHEWAKVRVGVVAVV